MPRAARRAKRASYKKKAKRATRKKSAKRTTKRKFAKRSQSWSGLGKLALKYGPTVYSGISKLSGFGDYTGLKAAQVPTIQNTSIGCIVRHREYVGDLQSSVGFVNGAYLINPGNPTLFPWLANIAANFEEWIPRGMIMEFRTMSSDTVVNVATGSPSLGSVIMATDYNIYNPAFTTKQQMEV